MQATMIAMIILMVPAFLSASGSRFSPIASGNLLPLLEPDAGRPIHLRNRTATQ